MKYKKEIRSRVYHRSVCLYTAVPMSLYRQYRPQTFEDVAGQTHIVETLQLAVEQDKIAHAYLFAGPRGTGKTSLARILAKHILVRGMEDEQVKKQILEGVEKGTVVDLVEIDAASNRGIDDVRELIERITFAPVAAAAKVYIIDEVHMLTREAFNALLKTLEEPPAHAYFILATTELHKIPLTIQSRCQRFAFKGHTTKDIEDRLQYVAEQEGLKLDADAKASIAGAVNGGMRDALSLLDQLRSLSTITKKDVQERVGQSSSEQAEQLLHCLQQGDAKGVLDTIHSIEQTGASFEDCLRLLMEQVRLALHEEIRAGRTGEGARNALELLLDSMNSMRHSPLPAATAETIVLSMLPHLSGKTTVQAPAAVPTPEPTTAAPSAQPEAPKKEAPKPTPTPAPTSASGQHDVESAWPTIMNKLEPASARMSLKDARIAQVKPDTLELSFSSSFHREKIANQAVSHALSELIRQETGSSLKVVCNVDTQTPPAAPPTEDAVDLASAAQDVF